MSLRVLLPPTWQWAVFQVALVLGAAIGVFVQPGGASSPARVELPPLAPATPLSGANANAFLACFPPPAETAMEALFFYESFQRIVERAGVDMTSRQVNDETTPRSVRRLHCALSGPTDRQVQVLGSLLRCPAPIRLVGFHWSAGSGPDARSLELTVDFFLRSRE